MGEGTKSQNANWRWEFGALEGLRAVLCASLILQCNHCGMNLSQICM